jgi:D-lactate dehydrogenase
MAKLIFMGANAQERLFIEKWAEQQGLSVVIECDNLTSANVDKTKGFEGVCFYPSPEMMTDEKLYHKLQQNGIKVLSIKSTGVDGINFAFAKKYDLTVTNVPAYSPTSVGHFAIMLMFMLLRYVPDYLCESHRKQDMGKELSDVTIGILGTGRIGSLVAEHLVAMGAKVIVHDRHKSPSLVGKVTYVTFETLIRCSDLISIHIPALSSNYHLFSRSVFEQMKLGAMLVNTARGAIVDTEALIAFLENGKLGGVALDAIEDEAAYFATGWRKNPLVQRLQGFSNVVLTPHIAYYTELAVREIVETSLDNALVIVKNGVTDNIVA